VWSVVSIGVPAVVGLVVFGLLRNRDTQPILAGCAAAVVSLVVLALFFGVIIWTASY
jgi:type IV secretory pathway TrbD component